MTAPVGPDHILAAHQLYCRLTGQSLGLRYDRERQWFELLRAGFSLEDLRRVITYLQGEIRQQRRNVGALKLSNLLQPDRFEEDLNIARVRLRPPPKPQPPPPAPPPPLSSEQSQARRTHALRQIRQIKRRLGFS